MITTIFTATKGGFLRKKIFYNILEKVGSKGSPTPRTTVVSGITITLRTTTVFGITITLRTKYMKRKITWNNITEVRSLFSKVSRL